MQGVITRIVGKINSQGQNLTVHNLVGLEGFQIQKGHRQIPPSLGYII